MATKSTIDALAKTINELIDESKPADSIVLDAGLTCFITPSTDIANAGMFCAAEIGPVGDRNAVHAYTATMLLF